MGFIRLALLAAVALVLLKFLMPAIVLIVGFFVLLELAYRAHRAIA